MTEVNSILNPIMMKVYSEGGGAEMPAPVPSETSAEPTIDEID